MQIVSYLKLVISGLNKFHYKINKFIIYTFALDKDNIIIYFNKIKNKTM